MIDITNKTVFENVSVKFNHLLAYVHSIVNHKIMLLLYIEGMGFPRIFYALHNGAPVGALPSAFYSEFGQKSVLFANVSISDHMSLRIHDNTLLTAGKRAFIAWI